jgi:hypothetical protein
MGNSYTTKHGTQSLSSSFLIDVNQLLKAMVNNVPNDYRGSRDNQSQLTHYVEPALTLLKQWYEREKWMDGSQERKMYNEVLHYYNLLNNTYGIVKADRDG